MENEHWPRALKVRNPREMKVSSNPLTRIAQVFDTPPVWPPTQLLASTLEGAGAWHASTRILTGATGHKMCSIRQLSRQLDQLSRAA